MWDSTSTPIKAICIEGICLDSVSCCYETEFALCMNSTCPETWDHNSSWDQGICVIIFTAGGGICCLDSFSVWTYTWGRSLWDTWGGLLPMIWEQFDPVGPDDMKRVFDAICATSCQLDPCPSWEVKASRMVTSWWIQAVLNIWF